MAGRLTTAPAQGIPIQALTEDSLMTVLSLSDLNLHDSELLEIVVDRVNRDADRITLRLDYIEDYESMRTTEKRLVFSGCVKAVFDMNFKVATPDSVNVGTEIVPSSLLEATREKLRKAGLTIDNAVRHFRIETNTTGSALDILAEKVEIVAADEYV